MKQTKSMRTVGVAALCVALGAAGGIASSGAATSTSKKANASRQGPPRGGPPGGRAVHEDAVVLNKAGNAFINATEDSGTVVSVSGDQLTIKEGTKSVTYKTLTLTIPSGATIKRNGSTAQLGDLKAGDHVHVTKSSDGTTVFAGDASFRPAGGPGHGPPPGGGYPPQP
jgi:hypothetical protein